MASQSKSIFEYDNYRDLLQDLYREHKSTNKRFSYRYFSKIAGFSSPNFLKRVMDGESNLSLESIEKFSKAFKFTKPEAHFFKNLVLLNQAQKTEEKKVFAEEILRSREYRRIHPLKDSQFNYYTQWYFVPVRELVALPNFKEDPEWIAKSITPNITPFEAQKAIDELLKLGILERDNKGRLVQNASNISTPDEVLSSLLAEFHREMMKKGAESIDRFPREKRDISSVTFGMSNKTAKRIKEIIHRFRTDILEAVSEDAQCDTIYQLNLQLFPLAEAATSEGDEKEKKD